MFKIGDSVICIGSAEDYHNMGISRSNQLPGMVGVVIKDKYNDSVKVDFPEMKGRFHKWWIHIDKLELFDCQSVFDIGDSSNLLDLLG